MNKKTKEVSNKKKKKNKQKNKIKSKKIKFSDIKSYNNTTNINTFNDINNDFKNKINKKLFYFPKNILYNNLNNSIISNIQESSDSSLEKKIEIYIKKNK